ncbi:histone RNA hairpin-binding protein [Teleopsis dalmanni]|uniref:histone RNA hairpin-binding protein n=1 Tax=Teleopsis dalmanni TaxID=139649 RepID=UPI0018CCD2CF|nr:histone RNA hairpin-binding protein [Teleopsis dalmanni]
MKLLVNMDNCEDMAVDCSPTKHESAGASKVNLSAASSEVSLDLKTSWVENVCESERTLHSCSRSSNEEQETGCNNSGNKFENSKSAREISLEFIDGMNEKKFDRLVKQDKLKTPFKRRYSNATSTDSRSDSPNSTTSGEVATLRNSFNSRKVEKRVRHNSINSSSSSASTEVDPAIISRRQKQIDYGKNTIAYERYLELIPRSQRTRDHPRTPNKYGKYSRRAFDGLVKIWRKQLHSYDPPINDAVDKEDKSSSDDSDSE